MDGHFRAFSFVDRITAVRPGVSIRGEYHIPAGLEAFPVSLVAESVGQLAAWAAMAAVDFSHRPVAGIAGKIELLSAVRPGQTLELTADLESVDTDAAGYCGAAFSGGQPVVRLSNCVGPMVPTEEFDDPQGLRKRFDLLCASGAAPGAFGGVPPIDLEPRQGEPGEIARAVLSVPDVVPFFTDHFPRRPVFPGTLLMHANLKAAEMLTNTVLSNGYSWTPRLMTDIKLRTFIAPGSKLDIEARRTAQSEGRITVTVESRIGKRLVSSAEIGFAAEAKP